MTTTELIRLAAPDAESASDCWRSYTLAMAIEDAPMTPAERLAWIASLDGPRPDLAGLESADSLTVGRVYDVMAGVARELPARVPAEPGEVHVLWLLSDGDLAELRIDGKDEPVRMDAATIAAEVGEPGRKVLGRWLLARYEEDREHGRVLSDFRLA